MTDDVDNEPESLLEAGRGANDPMTSLNNYGGDEQSLSAEERKHVSRDQVRRAVRKHGEDGIPISEIEELTDLSRKTVEKHLERLRTLREVYRQKKGNMYLYYPNGKPLHSVGREHIECSDHETGLELQIAKGKHDDLYFHITEKRFTLLDGETSEGAIIFPIEDRQKLADGLEALANEVRSEVEY